ncbi:TPA: hypothetical protein ACH3X1_010826 [Trebouxia sp. C0004]
MAAAAQAGVNAETGHPATASAASNSNAPKKKSMKKYLDRTPIGPAEMWRLQLLLCLAFVMCGWSFRSVKSPFFVDFCQNSRPKFDYPSAWLLRNTLFDLHIKSKHSKHSGCWMTLWLTTSIFRLMGGPTLDV